MSGPQVGYAGKVQVATDTAGTAGTLTTVGGGAKGSITPKVKAVDVTDFNAPGYEKSIPGLIGADLALECFYEPSDAGQAILLAALTARNKIWFRVYRDATRYSEAYCFVTEFPNDTEPGVAEKVQVKLQFSGDTTVAPATPLTIA